MKCKAFIPLIFLISSLSATDLTSQSYLYDNEGEPRFIKIYIDSPTPRNKRRTTSLQAGLQQILNRMAQEDPTGRYIVVPLKKKKGKDTDESVWECPYCGKSNHAFENRCTKKSCSLH